MKRTTILIAILSLILLLSACGDTKVNGLDKTDDSIIDLRDKLKESDGVTEYEGEIAYMKGYVHGDFVQDKQMYLIFNGVYGKTVLIITDDNSKYKTDDYIEVYGTIDSEINTDGTNPFEKNIIVVEAIDIAITEKED